MRAGEFHLAFDEEAGAFHVDFRPRDAEVYAVSKELLLELVEAAARGRGRHVKVIRHDLLLSHTLTGMEGVDLVMDGDPLPLDAVERPAIEGRVIEGTVL